MIPFLHKTRQMGVAVDAPPPREGEVLRTRVPDTMAGIRFEMSRMVETVREAVGDPVVVDAARMVLLASTEKNRISEMAALYGWSKAHFHYVSDPIGKEYMQTTKRMVRQTQVPRAILARILQPIYSKASQGVVRMSGKDMHGPLPMALGDCIPLDQEVLVRNRSSRKYMVMPVGELKDKYSYYHAVSYNEMEEKFEFKPITNFIEKGRLKVYKVRLSNGAQFRCTEDHKLYAFIRTGKGEYELTTLTLSELIEQRKRQRTKQAITISCAMRIPEAELNERDHPKVSNAQAFVEGLYVAEGWSEVSAGLKGGRFKAGEHRTMRAKIGMNNPHAIGALKTNLAVLGQPYGEHLRKDGLVTVRMNVSEMTTRLGMLFGRNSAEKRFPEWYPSLDRETLTVLLSAYALGDGYVPTHGEKAEYLNLVYNTASEHLAEQLNLMHMVLGRPLSLGVDKPWHDKPKMYRLHEYKRRKFGERKPNLCPNTIKMIEPDGEAECCDITVADNHNFLLGSGVLVHNCEEASTFLAGMLGAIGILPRFRFGGAGKSLYHVWVQGFAPPDASMGIDGDGRWIDMDITEKSYELGQHAPFQKYAHMDIFEA